MTHPGLLVVLGFLSGVAVTFLFLSWLAAKFEGDK